MAAVGIRVWSGVRARSMRGALTAARSLGWPVALKAADEGLRRRVDLGGVRLDIRTERDLRAAYDAISKLASGDVVVQRMAPPGVAVSVDAVEDPLFGAVVSVGVGGIATELLGDRAYRAVPLTDMDAAEMVRSLRAAPLLLGWRGAEAVDVAALEDLLLRVSLLLDEVRRQRPRGAGDGRRCGGAAGHRPAAAGLSAGPGPATGHWCACRLPRGCSTTTHWSVHSTRSACPCCFDFPR